MMPITLVSNTSSATWPLTSVGRTDAGVVDEDVEVALAAGDDTHSGRDGFIVTHFKVHKLGDQFGRGRLAALDIAGSDVHGVP
jgi:hypothetical protein